MKFRLAVAQTDAVIGDIEHNVATHLECATRARDQGARIVVFPELSLTGYTIRDLNMDLAVRPDTLPRAYAALLEISREIAILAGGVEEDDDSRIFNSAFLFEGGTAKVVHRKVYPPTYGMFEESRYFSAGSSVRAFDTGLGRMGVVVCEDAWHLALPYLLAADGARTVIVMAASPTRLSEDGAVQEANAENHRAFARLLSVYVVFANRVGYEDGVSFWGGSEILGPDGSLVARARLFERDLVLADLAEDELRQARRFSRHALDDDPRLVLRELARLVRV